MPYDVAPHIGHKLGRTMHRRARLALIAAAVAATALVTGIGSASAAGAAATETYEEGEGAGFYVSFVDGPTTEPRPGSWLRGNTVTGYVQTFQNAGRPLFVDGVLQDLDCAPGQDPLADECTTLAVHVLSAGRARLVAADDLATVRLIGTVLVTDTETDRTRTAPIALRLHGTGPLEPHHYIDEVVTEEYELRYTETGHRRVGVATGRIAGATVTASDASLLRFAWSRYERIE